MKRPEKIHYWNMPYTDMIPDGYDMKDIPALAKENIKYLVDEHNKLVDIVNTLIAKLVEMGAADE